MMDRYVAHTKDVAFLQWVPCQCWRLPRAKGNGFVPGLRCCLLQPRENIGTLASELDFWTVNRTVSVVSGGQSYVLNRYYVPYGGPR